MFASFQFSRALRLGQIVPHMVHGPIVTSPEHVVNQTVHCGLLGLSHVVLSIRNLKKVSIGLKTNTSGTLKTQMKII